MNEPSSILEQAQRRGGTQRTRDVVAATTRRCACVLALVLLFLTTGVGSLPNLGAGAQGPEFRMEGNAALAGTLENQGDSYAEMLSLRTRHKTH